MDALTETLYLGNTLLQWLTAAGIIVGSVIVAKILYWMFGGMARKLTRRTRTRLDDLLIDMLEEPVVFAVIIIGIWFGLGRLDMPENLSNWIGMGYQLLIVFNVAWFVVRFLDALIEEYIVPLVEKTEGELDDQLLPIIRKAMKITIWAMALVIALNNAGYDVGALLAGLGIGGLAFALAAQDTVANLFGGFTIFADKPFTINERVVLDGYDGIVEEIGIRSTRLRTLAGRLVTIPNSRIANNVVENISSEPGRKVVMTLGLTYDTDENGMQKAMDLLKGITAAEVGVDDERTLVAFSGFGDFSLNILLIYWIRKEADILDVQTRVNMKILETFNGNKLEFAFPTQTILTAPVG